MVFFHGFFIDGADTFLNLNGLAGRLDPGATENAVALDPELESLRSYNRKIRLPLFVAGLASIGKGVYGVANYFIHGDPLGTEVTMDFALGGGFLCTASSMYLKDQDPKLLEKKPSKIKSFLKGIYEKVRDLKPLPTLNPCPVPVRYSTLEDCL